LAAYGGAVFLVREADDERERLSLAQKVKDIHRDWGLLESGL